ncbi:hypothetical protein NFJ02_16g24700 [Pycnococcus provasolii]
MLALRILNLLEALSVNVGDDLRAHLPSLLLGVVALLSGIECGDVASHELVPQALHTLILSRRSAGRLTISCRSFCPR